MVKNNKRQGQNMKACRYRHRNIDYYELRQAYIS